MNFFSRYWNYIKIFLILIVLGGIGFLGFNSLLPRSREVTIVHGARYTPGENTIYANEFNWLVDLLKKNNIKPQILEMSISKELEYVSTHDQTIGTGFVCYTPERAKIFEFSEFHSENPAGFIVNTTALANKKEVVIGIVENTTYHSRWLADNKHHKDIMESFRCSKNINLKNIRNFDVVVKKTLSELLSDIVEGKVDIALHSETIFKVKLETEQSHLKFTPFIVNGKPVSEKVAYIFHNLDKDIVNLINEELKKQKPDFSKGK